MSYGPDIIENTLMKVHPQLLELLLCDRSTGKNIFWATNSYENLGEGYQYADEITPEKITGVHGDVIRPRALKSREEQARRVKGMAEVFTPAWICRKMNDFADTQLWVSLDKEKDWRTYVQKRCLELTCGEAPFLVSRYDSVSGKSIPLNERIGLLDRKLRIVGEMATDEEYPLWALLAVASVYGYEWQGDNLLLAREAVVATFAEYYKDHTGAEPPEDILMQVAEIVSWNLWQMDGLKAVVPHSCHDVLPPPAPTLAGFELPLPGETLLDGFNPHARQCPGCEKDDMRLHNGVRCRLRRWVAADNVEAGEHKNTPQSNYIENTQTTYPMKFDFVIGNPPYQDETLGDNKGFAPPVYDKFLEGAYQVADKVEMIHPARFLFNAGSTPKQWNKKMLNDEHLKVLSYKPDASTVFPNTDIKGGVVVSYRNEKETYGAIGIFTPYEELNSILKKVLSHSNKMISEIAVSRTAYHLTDIMHTENPSAIGRLSKGHAYDMSTNIFDSLPFIFLDAKPNDGKEYALIIGRVNNQREYKYIRRDYINDVSNFNGYKLLFPKAMGRGAFGEVLASPIIGEPGLANTETFMSIGNFKSKSEAEHLLLYIKSKFARCLLSVNKVTQDNTPASWKYVPLQNFTEVSDIDWSVSVKEIDRQLYKKYGLSEGEIAFIEEKVREME